MNKTELKYTPSKTKQYVHCAYFLKLSNTVKIPIEEPHIVGIRRTQLFKDEVIGRLSIRKGFEPVRAQKPLYLILNPGFYLIQKKIDAAIYETDDVSLIINMFKPDLIETKIDGDNIYLNVKSIRNTDELNLAHYLQAYIYKLALEKTLMGSTIKTISIAPSIISWNYKDYPLRDNADLDIEEFSSHLSGDDFFSEINMSEDQQLYADKIKEIALLEPQEDKTKCDSCEGQFCCDVYHDIEFFDRFAWFDKFN